MTTNSQERKSLAEAINALGELAQCDGDALGEFEAQYYSEIAHYGDAWPGSAEQLQSLREGIYTTRQELDACLEWEKKIYGIE